LSNPSTKNLPENKKENKFRIFIWTLFDFANTSYSIVVVTFVFAVYFKEVVASNKPAGDLFWSLGISISMIITAFVSPVLGAIADYSSGKKRFLLFFTLLCIVSTAIMYFLNEGDIIFALVLFILANIGFEAGLVFYDAFLPELTSPKNYGRVSGYGFGMGYLGSLVILLIIVPFIQDNLIKETFPVAAAFFLLFAAPLFFFIHDFRKKTEHKESYFKVGFGRVFTTIKNLKYYKNLVIFLLSFFFYIEGVNTVIFFAGNYAKTTLHFSMTNLIFFFLIVQTTAILGAVLFGIISDSLGQKKTIQITLYIWLFTILVAYVTSGDGAIVQYLSDKFTLPVGEIQQRSFYLVGLLAGGVIGATQSTSRSLMSKLTPYEKKTEFFGFYSLFGKSSAVLGPVVFGVVSYITGNQRFAILSIAFFFIVGLIVLNYVKDPDVKTQTIQ